jgi:thymidylate synthase
MLHNYVFDSVNDALPRLLADLRESGEEVPSRAGETLELTHVGITLNNPTFREIVLPDRKASLAAQIAETVWVLAGKSDVGWLEHYLPRAGEFSDDGQNWRAGYGQRLRAWPRRDGSGDVIDQYRWAVEHLQEKPESRQAVMSIWDPVVDTTPGKDIPCNDWLSFSCRKGALDLHVAVRSNDVIWGWSGINQFEWSTLLEVTAGLLGLKVGKLHFSTTSFHLYEHHYRKSRKIVERFADPNQPSTAALVAPLILRGSPRFNFRKVVEAGWASGTPRVDNLDYLLHRWFLVEKGIRSGSNVSRDVENFPEPMLQSWLRVLQWWWTGDRSYLDPLKGAPLYVAASVGMQPPSDVLPRLRPEAASASAPSDVPPLPEATSDFMTHAINLHNSKHRAYGDSWKKRGETIGIMANIARKVDRLGRPETDDETALDTALDLMIYLAKYLVWVRENVLKTLPAGVSDDTVYANWVLLETEDHVVNLLNTEQGRKYLDADDLEKELKDGFETLQLIVLNNFTGDLNRNDVVGPMLRQAYGLARARYEEASATR